jgi:hypothetical protein
MVTGVRAVGDRHDHAAPARMYDALLGGAVSGGLPGQCCGVNLSRDRCGQSRVVRSMVMLTGSVTVIFPVWIPAEA